MADDQQTAHAEERQSFETRQHTSSPLPHVTTEHTVEKGRAADKLILVLAVES